MAANTLTEQQRRFCLEVVKGKYNNADCARRAGYSDKYAAKRAYLLLGESKIVEYIEQLREELGMSTEIELSEIVEHFRRIREEAMMCGNYAAANKANEALAKLGGHETGPGRPRTRTSSTMHEVIESHDVGMLDRIGKLYKMDPVDVEVD